jgi:hypothetical protein
VIFQRDAIHFFGLLDVASEQFKVLSLNVSNLPQKLFGFVVHK